MFWDKKRNTLPDLPSSDSEKASISDYQRKRPEMQDNFDEGLHELPSFPDSPMQKGFSQAAIKDAVINEEIEESDDTPSLKTTELAEPVKKQYSVVEMDDWSPTKPLPSAPITRVEPRPRGPEKPVFVRLDKFQTARNSLDAVRQKLDEAEDLLKKIREVKQREDQELVLWEREMETIKSRIKGVLGDIFEKTEQY